MVKIIQAGMITLLSFSSALVFILCQLFNLEVVTDQTVYPHIPVKP